MKNLFHPIALFVSCIDVHSQNKSVKLAPKGFDSLQVNITHGKIDTFLFALHGEFAFALKLQMNDTGYFKTGVVNMT
jgi:hypothetical protein